MKSLRPESALPRISNGNLGFLRKFGFLMKGAANALVLGEEAVAHSLRDMGLSVDLLNMREMKPCSLVRDDSLQAMSSRGAEYDLVLLVFPEFESDAQRHLVLQSLPGFVRASMQTSGVPSTELAITGTPHRSAWGTVRGSPSR